MTEPLLKALDTRLARHKYDLLHAEIYNLQSQISDSAGKTDQFNAEISNRESQISDLRRSLSEIEHTVTFRLR